MKQTIVLIRHGEAKRKQLGQSDFDRELTVAGAASLRRAFPKMLENVPLEGKTELWVSPAARARQTAEIANATLGIESVRYIDALYEQDQRKFLAELSGCDADTLVVVAHIPFVEDACAVLCGAWQSFSVGSAACIELEDDKATGRLLWFEPGPVD